MTDVIVIGAGSAGSVITRRLLDAGAEVTLLEAGGSDVDPSIQDLGRLGELWGGPNDWNYFTTPQRNAFDRRIHWPRGRVLGGSHSLNASIYVRGAHGDYDRWVREGATGWSWDEVLPVFRRIEHFDGGASEYRVEAGLLDVTTDYPRNPVFEAIHDAAVAAGVPANPDYNGATIEGVSWMQLNLRDGERFSSYRAYLRPVQDDPRLTLRTGAWVHRLLFDGGRVTGVEVEIDGTLERLHADEVVLAAGTLDSPRVLLHSGIGPAGHLRDVGIDVVVDRSGVGENLHDHLLVPFLVQLDRAWPERQVNEPVAQVHSFTTFREGSDVPDTQPIYFDVPMIAPDGVDLANVLTLQAGLVRPESRGTFRLASADPRERPLMDPNILDEQADVESLRRSMAQIIDIAGQSPLAEAWGARIVFPTPDALDDASLDRHMREWVTTYHHQVGTCRMGTDDGAVVDPTTFRVHGVDGLRVADASIMPSVPSGNTNAPSILIGERASDAIIADGAFGRDA